MPVHFERQRMKKEEEIDAEGDEHEGVQCLRWSEMYGDMYVNTTIKMFVRGRTVPRMKNLGKPAD
jgi:hypothetical protein